jgi:DNA processing protein
VLGVGREGPLGVVAVAAPQAGDPVAELVPAGPMPAGTRESAAPPPVVAMEGTRAAAGSTALARPRRLGEREAWVVLASIDGLGPVTFGALLRACGSARQVLEAASRPGGAARLVAAAAAEDLRLGPEIAVAVGQAADLSRVLLDRLVTAGVEPITAEDGAYPARLRAIELPPPVLFVRGDPGALAPLRAVAVVGTRRPTDDGRAAASHIAGVLAAAGATVVSGLAVGIDGAAHAGALLAEGTTVGVLGSGHARLYPPAHAHLAREIVRRGGAVVAEVPPDAIPRPAGFPRRNRIIAALADATVVVEAGEHSGALITASWALEQGRAVFAVPGPLGRPQSVGCNRLLRAQPGEVRIVAGTDELLEDLGYGVAVEVRRPRPERSEAPGADAGAIMARLGPAESAVVRRLLDGPATADALAEAAGHAAATVLAVLTRLEDEGLVAGTFGRYHLAGALSGARLAPARRRRPAPSGSCNP